MFIPPVLNADNFLFFAIKYYNNPRCNGVKDLREDLSLFKLLNKHINKYRTVDQLDHRLLVNNIIILRNVWGEFLAPMLFYKIKKDNWGAIKSVLLFLNIMPTTVNVGQHVISADAIVEDEILTKRLQSL
jgi:hypothetical protein